MAYIGSPTPPVIANVSDSSITAAKLATDAVTSVKIADDAVTSAKLIDDAVTSAKLASGAVTAADLPAGSIVQTISNTGNTTVSTTTTAFPGAEVINVSITPTSATNKLLIIATGECSIVDSTNAYSAWHIYQDDTTDLAQVYPGTSSAIIMRVVAAFNFTMTAGTTSSTKFSLYLRKGSSGTTSCSTDGSDYGISVMEIAV